MSDYVARAWCESSPEEEYKRGKGLAQQLQQDHPDYRERMPAIFEHMVEARIQLKALPGNERQAAYLNGWLSVWKEQGNHAHDGNNDNTSAHTCTNHTHINPLLNQTT